MEMRREGAGLAESAREVGVNFGLHGGVVIRNEEAVVAEVLRADPGAARVFVRRPVRLQARRRLWCDFIEGGGGGTVFFNKRSFLCRTAVGFRRSRTSGPKK